MRYTRRLLVSAGRAALRILASVEITGRENLPQGGPLIVVFNHVAHADGPVVIASLPWEVEAISLSDLLRVPLTGQLLRLYGVIVVHRDAYDRELLRRALGVLAEGKVLALAPEARQSPARALERGREGAAYLALRSGAALLPIGLTGTDTVPSRWKRLGRPRITVTIGPPFRLPGPLSHGAARRAQLDSGRDEIMRRIAALLPAQYQGVYAQ